MSRLTKKFEDNSGYTVIVNHPVRKEITLFDFEEEDYNCCVDKLAKLEDIEEELGCPLEVVFKVLFKNEGIRTIKNNIYYVHKIVRMSTGHLAFELELAQYFYLKDYKKTWWLRGEKND